MKINEIISVARLVQPTDEQKRQLLTLDATHLDGNLYYLLDGDELTVIAKDDTQLLGYLLAKKRTLATAIGEVYFIVNLYSWANDHGQTTSSLLRAAIQVAGKTPLVSDNEMTPSAISFFKKYISHGGVKAATLDLSNGNVTGYDSSIWDINDDHRVLMLSTYTLPSATTNESRLGIPVMPFEWNWFDRHK